MNQVELHLNPKTNKWEYRDGETVLLSFCYVGQGYFTDAGEPLGAVWKDALSKAEQLAGKRRDRKILEDAR